MLVFRSSMYSKNVGQSSARAHPKIGTPAIQIQQDSNQQISKLSKQ